MAIAKLKGYLQKTEGLFTGFNNNLMKAFQLNMSQNGEVNVKNVAKSADTWKTIGYSIASLGLASKINHNFSATEKIVNNFNKAE